MSISFSTEDATMLWQDVVEMAHDLPDTSMIPWLERLVPVSLENGTMTVSTRQNWTVKRIMGEYREPVEQLLGEITLEPIELQVIVAGTQASPIAAHEAASASQDCTMFHVKQTEPAAANDEETQVARPSAAALAGAAVAAGRGAIFSNRFPSSTVASTPVEPIAAEQERDGGAATSVPCSFEPLTQPETTEQEAVVPILQDGTIPTDAVNSGYADFTFETYIVGEANDLAYNMARAVAEQPGTLNNLNPLFIWGPSGNGKSHLLLAIANYLWQHQPCMNVQYVPANAFVNQYIDDIRNKRLKGSDVLRSYRDVDVLLVDDVQAFQNKQESVTTFFDIFNELILAGKQIVLAADTPPDYLEMDDRMRTRFGSGLVVDIKAPTYEMKRSILMSFYDRCRQRMDLCKNVEIPEHLFDTIAEVAPSSPRSIQGLVTSIMIKAQQNPSVLTVEGIKRAVKENFKTNDVPTVAAIIRAVCKNYGVTAEDIRGKSRVKNISEARQIVMWMARQLTEESYDTIGAELGGRDHSTVYYGISTVEKRTLEDKAYLYKLERLKKEITG